MSTPVETQPQATQDQAPAVPPATGDTVTTVASPPAEQTDTTQGQPVDSVEELQPPDNLKESWNALPPEHRSLVNKVYTQVRQRDAAKLKEHPGQALLDAYQRDPIATHKAIEAQLRGQGLLKDGETPQPPQQLSQQTEDTFAKLAEHFGPDAVQLMRQAFTAELQKEVQPLRQAVGQTVAEATQGKAQAAIAAFEAKHPGWKKYEQQMAAEALRITEGGKIPSNMPVQDWLEFLYRNVAFNDLLNAQVAATVTKMQQSARTAEPQSPAVAASRVAKKAPTLDDFKGDERAYARAAGEAAQRGELWE